MATTWAAIAAAGITLAAAGPGESRRLADAAALVEAARPQVPDEYWNQAHCVLAFPREADAIRDEAHGVVSCRAGDGWTAPLFLVLATAGRGTQTEAGRTADLVLLVMNESGAGSLLHGSVRLGTDAAVSPGRVDASGSAVDANRTDILAYSQVDGVVSGADIAGAVLSADVAANAAIYGGNSSPSRVLAMRELSAPPDAEMFLRSLGGGKSTPAATSGTTTPPAEPPPSPPSASDDVRARLLAAQQTIDRLLADTSASAIAAGGTAPDPAQSVTIDRARLIQLRQQIEAALAALGRRQ